MTWTRLDDGFWMHPKIMRAGNEGAGVFTRLLSYCGCYLTDGLVPFEVAQHIAGGTDVLDRLDDAGLIEIQASGSVYIPDYLEHNPTRDEVEAKRDQRREAGRRGGRASRRNAA